MRSVPAREWLAVALPGVFGFTLLIAGAVAAADANEWLAYALAAGIGATLPLLYTFQLAREHRLFLGKGSTLASSRRRVARLMPVGWLLGAAALVVLIAVGDSGKTILYGVLGGAALGIWPGLLANFIRLWREEWQSRA